MTQHGYGLQRELVIHPDMVEYSLTSRTCSHSDVAQQVTARIIKLGAFYFKKVMTNQRESGTHQAAKNLRKQGVPLGIALAVLVGQMIERPDTEKLAAFFDKLPPLDFCD